MSRQSGEQARRVLKGAAASARYAEVMLTRDKLRVIKALRDTANRLEREAKSEIARNKATRWEASDLAVTDHAVLRFLERAMGLDVDAIRTQIARLVPTAKLSTMATAGEHAVHVRDGFQFLLTPHAVISVLSPGMEARDWLEREDVEALGVA